MLTYGVLCSLAEKHGVTITENMRAFVRAVEQSDQAEAEPIAWESTTPFYRKYLTQSGYERIGEQFRKWYKPYRCSACANTAPAAAQAGLSEATWQLSDEDWDAIYDSARRSFERHKHAIKGQMISPADGLDYHVALAVAELLKKRILSRAPATPQSDWTADECVATGQTCAYGPHGRHGETQCKYCGAKPSTQSAQPAEPSHWEHSPSDEFFAKQAHQSSGDERAPRQIERAAAIVRWVIHVLSLIAKADNMQHCRVNLSYERDSFSRAIAKLYEAENLLAAQSVQRAGAVDAKVLPFAVLDALRFYANGSHFCLADKTAWDTVSGEPQNFWCDEAGTATVEDGSIAKAVLQGVAFTDGDNAAAVDGEVYTAQKIAAAPMQHAQQGENA